VAEIHNDTFLTLTDQEEYINPYTNEVDVGSNQWKHRWVTEGGDVFYTDDENSDPNRVSTLNRTDWKETKVRPSTCGQKFLTLFYFLLQIRKYANRQIISFSYLLICSF